MNFWRFSVYLKWADGPEAGFVVLSQKPGPASGRPIKIDQLGIHHFAFWVSDLRERVERLKSAGVKILVGPYESDSIAYGEALGKKVLTCLFEDPDGIILQFRPAAGLKARAAGATRPPPSRRKPDARASYRGASPCAAGASG